MVKNLIGFPSGKNSSRQHQEQSIGARAPRSSGPSQGTQTGVGEEEKGHGHQRGKFSGVEAPNHGSLQPDGLLPQTLNILSSQKCHCRFESHASL